MTDAVREQEQQTLVDRLMSACGGSDSPEARRNFFICGPQWAAAYKASGDGWGNPGYLHEVMWGSARRAAMARAYWQGNCGIST